MDYRYLADESEDDQSLFQRTSSSKKPDEDLSWCHTLSRRSPRSTTIGSSETPDCAGLQMPSSKNDGEESVSQSVSIRSHRNDPERGNLLTHERGSLQAVPTLKPITADESLVLKTTSQHSSEESSWRRSFSRMSWKMEPKLSSAPSSNGSQSKSFHSLIEAAATAQEVVDEHLRQNHFRDVNSSRKTSRISRVYPIHQAVLTNDVELVRSLLMCDANPLARDSWGRTALQRARVLDKNGSHKELIEILCTHPE